MIRDMLDDWVGRGFLLFFIVIIALIPVGIYQIIHEHNEWEIFKAQHVCKIVAHMKGDSITIVAPIIGGNGNGGVAVGVSQTPDKTAWLCDDGVTYWR